MRHKIGQPAQNIQILMTTSIPFECLNLISICIYLSIHVSPIKQNEKLLLFSVTLFLSYITTRMFTLRYVYALHTHRYAYPKFH